MEIGIENEIKKHVVSKLLKAIKFKSSKLAYFSGEDSVILSVRRNNRNVMIRITPENIKSYYEIMGELEVIDYLIDKGVPIAKPLFINGNEKTLKFELKGKKYTICIFEKAKGKGISPTDREPNVYDKHKDKNVEQIFFKFGIYTAIMHNSLGEYKPSDKNYKRPDVSQYISKKITADAEDKIIYTIYRKFLKEINLMPRNKKTFGLVHFDLHASNFHVYKNDLIFFDFADTLHSFYLWDVAKVFFYNIPFNLNSKNDLMLFKKKYDCFIEGYKERRTLVKKDIELVKFFMKFTEIRMYLKLSEHMREYPKDKNPWIRGFMKDRKENLTNNFTVFDAMKNLI